MFKARINSIFPISPTVKQLSLRLLEDGFIFKPGQWVDFIVPDVKEVAGYSISSSPSLLKSTGQIELAVKKSEFAPTKWVHSQAKVGHIVDLRPGGTFFYDFETQSSFHLLFIGGGVGINPLYSMFQVCAENPGKQKVTLLHSAVSLREMLFRKQIDALTKTHTNFSAKWFVSKPCELPAEDLTTVNRRISEEDIASAIHGLDSEKNENILCYLCGPPPMVKDLKLILQQYLPDKCIFYENWWDPPNYG